jgi:3-deoxy-manno-octulosonate cytidylyltransferase (CMP-KDO synthetase)
MSRLETNRDGSDTEAEQGFTVLIPARLASTRLPNKPLADLGGAADGRARRPARSATQRGTARLCGGRRQHR